MEPELKVYHKLQWFREVRAASFMDSSSKYKAGSFHGMVTGSVYIVGTFIPEISGLFFGFKN